MTIKNINPDTLFARQGYTQVTIGTGTKHVHTSGQVAVDAEGNLVGDGPNYRAQAFQAASNVYAALAAAGASASDVLHWTLYVVDPTGDNLEQFVIGFREARLKAEGAETAATLVGVTALAVPGAVVEIDASAVLD
jgi:enamine deaminase RidA (YjgF/YER057c/UK114 family)